MLETGLVKPLEIGDNGAPLTIPEDDGDFENISDVRRGKCGVVPLYKSRVVMGEVGCGKAGERATVPGPGEFLYAYVIIVRSQ